MSILSNKYNIPEDIVKQMIKDGDATASFTMWDRIVDLHKQGKSTLDISEMVGISQRRVQGVIKKYGEFGAK